MGQWQGGAENLQVGMRTCWKSSFHVKVGVPLLSRRHDELMPSRFAVALDVWKNIREQE